MVADSMAAGGRFSDVVTPTMEAQMDSARRSGPKVVPFRAPVAGAAARLDAATRAAVDGRVRTLRLVAAAMLGGVALLVGASVVAVRVATAPPPSLRLLALVLTAAALIFILAASLLRAALFGDVGRAAGRGVPDAEPEARAAAVADAYALATTLSFALLDAAAALGLVAAVVTGSLAYTLVICGAAALAAALRWPRRAALARLLAAAARRQDAA
jgi:hypothetical protein